MNSIKKLAQNVRDQFQFDSTGWLGLGFRVMVRVRVGFRVRFRVRFRVKVRFNSGYFT